MAVSSPFLQADFEEPEPLAGNYYIAVYPPFSAWDKAQLPRLAEALHAPPVPSPLGLYIHIPFCQRKCDYCYYLSFTNQPAAVVDRYIDTLVHELQCYAACPAIQGRQVDFVYFGGGTPSLLTPAQLRRLSGGLQQALPWEGVEEVTFECAPRSVRPELLSTLRDMGVTRLSMGVQSFDNVVLKLNGRVHLAEDVTRAYQLIRGAGFDHVNLDLMVGLIGEKPEKWRDSVRQVIALAPESVTIYQTEIPYNTQLYRELQTGCPQATPVPWETKRARLLYGFDQLELNGYHLASAYHALRDALKYPFRYQQHLWHGADLLGLGVASFGYVQGVHYQNEVFFNGYQDHVARHQFPWQRAFALNDWDQFVREFILQLKLGSVSRAAFLQKFGGDILVAFAQPLTELSARGWLVADQEGVRLTRAGLLRVDRLLPWFFDPPYSKMRYT